MEYSLQMVFVCENGDKTSMTITEVRSNLSKDEITGLMDTIINNNVFAYKNGLLVSKYSAQILERQVTKFDLSK